MSDELYVDEVAEQTDISERNVKYWSKKYDLPVEKDGRSNVYPERTVKCLRLVKVLSESELFNHRFIQVQVHRALDNAGKNGELEEKYQEVRRNGKSILGEFESPAGVEILPALEGSSSKSKAGRRRARAAKEDIDDVLL